MTEQKQKKAETKNSSVVVVNPKLNADSVKLTGEKLGGEGEKKNRFYAHKKYEDVPESALEQKASTGQQLLVKL